MKTEVLLLPVVYFPLEFMIFCCEGRKYANIFIPIHAYVHHVLLVTCSPTAPLPFHGMGSVVGIEREEEVTAECNGSAKGAPLACIYIYIYTDLLLALGLPYLSVLMPCQSMLANAERVATVLLKGECWGLFPSLFFFSVFLNKTKTFSSFRFSLIAATTLSRR